ncbi:MAG: porin family protein [Prevotella sp.]|nr:porin family protein [Prevotella sp.]
MQRGLGMIILLLTLTKVASAQSDPEYRLEIGAGAGIITYQGDFNGNILKSPTPMFSALAKYRFNPRMALAMNVSYGKIKGASKDATTYTPATWQDYSFNHGLLDAGIRYEYNFWPYGTGREYRGAKRVTPYIYIGLGMTLAKPDKTEGGMNFPIGGGVKYKVADRVNMALEWAMHFTTSDYLDGVKDPYDIPSSGLFKNTDCYSHLRLSVTYDIWAKCRTCHNDKD